MLVMCLIIITLGVFNSRLASSMVHVGPGVTAHEKQIHFEDQEQFFF